VRVCVCVCVCVCAPESVQTQQRTKEGKQREIEELSYVGTRIREKEKAKGEVSDGTPSRSERVGSGPCMLKYKAFDSNLGSQCSGASYRSQPKDAVRMQHFVMNPRRGTEMSNAR
jgi:hypothetical protein